MSCREAAQTDTCCRIDGLYQAAGCRWPSPGFWHLEHRQCRSGLPSFAASDIRSRPGCLDCKQQFEQPDKTVHPSDSQLSRLPPLKIRLLITLALLLLAGPGQAQIANFLTTKPKIEAAKGADAPAPVDPRAEAEKQLAEARGQQEAGRRESGTAPEAEELPTTERQRLLDRLVAAYGERLNLIDEADSLRKSALKLEDRSEQVAEFSGSPPTRRGVSMRCATSSI